MAKKIDLSFIDNLDDLHAEQARVKLRVKAMETELGDNLQRLPGELVFTGLNAVVPAFLAGKVVSSVLSLIRNTINSFFVKDKHKEHPDKPRPKNHPKTQIFRSLKSLGLFSILKIVYKFYMRKMGR